MAKCCKLLSWALCLLAYAAPVIVHAGSTIPKDQEWALADEAQTVIMRACDYFIADPSYWGLSSGCDPSGDNAPDYIKARQLFEKVVVIESAVPPANRHYTRQAANALACMYRDGLGVIADYQQAARYFALAIEHGDTDYAMAELGWFYLHGLGVEQNLALAKQYLLPVENGYSGRDYLAYIYAEGVIVEKDEEKAAMHRSCLLEENETCCFYAECKFDVTHEKWLGN